MTIVDIGWKRVKEMIKPGMIVKYAEEWCEPAERNHMMVVLEAYPDVQRCLVQHLDTGMDIAPTETVMFEMVVPTGMIVGEGKEREHVVKIKESFYDEICRILTYYEDGTPCGNDMYAALLKITRLYEKGEEV